MGWSLHPKRRAIQKINGFVEKIIISHFSSWTQRKDTSQFKSFSMLTIVFLELFNDRLAWWMLNSNQVKITVKSWSNLMLILIVSNTSNHNHKHFWLKDNKMVIFDKFISFIDFSTFRVSLHSLSRNCHYIKISFLLIFQYS